MTVPTFEEALHAPRQHSIVRGFYCNLLEHSANLYVAPGHSPDMIAVVAMCEAMDAQAQWINVWSGTEPDTAYRRVNDRWQAATMEHAGRDADARLWE